MACQKRWRRLLPWASAALLDAPFLRVSAQQPSLQPKPRLQGGIEARVERLAEFEADVSDDPATIATAKQVEADISRDQMSSTKSNLRHDYKDVLELVDKAVSQESVESAIKSGVYLTGHDLAELTNVRRGGHLVNLEEAQAAAFQGDMMFANASELTKFTQLFFFSARDSWAGPLWDSNTVKYCFAPDVNPIVQEAVRTAANQYQKAVPGLEWKELEHVQGNSYSTFAGDDWPRCSESPAIFVTSKNIGCFSYVGMRAEWPSQQLNLQSPGCDAVGTAIHELGHAIGMAHEQSRPDRRKYVEIHWDNIPDDKASNFDVDDNGDTERPYAILSVMHYDSHAFAEDTSQPTITVKDDAYKVYTANPEEYYLYEIGNRFGLSQYDAEQVAQMYGVGAATLTSETECQDRTENGQPWSDSNGRTCADYVAFEDSGHIDDCSEYVSGYACCACGGGWRVQTWDDSKVTDFSIDGAVISNLHLCAVALAACCCVSLPVLYCCNAGGAAKERKRGRQQELQEEDEESGSNEGSEESSDGDE